MQTSASLLTNTGLRPTKARLAVLTVIFDAKKALSHAEIAAALEPKAHFDRVTVYRVLECLLEHQLIHKISTEDRAWKYQLNTPSPQAQYIAKNNKSSFLSHTHAHLHCTLCGGVTCIHEFTTSIPSAILSTYLVSQVEVTLKGVCPLCKVDTSN
ncbi:MAG TPA: transcriptional repressor [Methylotenera sp.]|nr:transcriptional repressor [Methylotenera sp.]HPH04793.1 transcriptional repressor [Methylotenera sp.]HPN01584.1 transcriptional repressor [Methylotenera sp.]